MSFGGAPSPPAPPPPPPPPPNPGVQASALGNAVNSIRQRAAAGAGAGFDNTITNDNGPIGVAASSITGEGGQKKVLTGQ